MKDCSRVDIRDMLPSYEHGRLSAVDRDAVAAHLANCPDCVTELSLVRSAARALAGAPAVDLARIVAALPVPPRRREEGAIPIDSRRARSRPPRTAWASSRRLTAIAAVAVGAAGLSFAVGRSAPDRPDSALVAGSVTPVVGTVRAPASPAAASGLSSAADPGGLIVASAADAELSVAGGVSDLSDDALRSLLGDIERIDDVTVADPAEPLPAVTDLDEEGGA